LIGKIAATLLEQRRSRGLFITALMSLSQCAAMLRAAFYKLLYWRALRCSIFSMQGRSTIEVFSKRAAITIGKFVFIRKNASIRIDHDGQLSIGDKTFINDNCSINCVGTIAIGSYTKIAPNVSINDHDHNYKGGSDSHLIIGKIVIGDHVWIGSNCVILRDTVIGDGAVIAAGSVVKGEVPAHTLFMNRRENAYIRFKEAAAEPGSIARAEGAS